MRCELGPDDVLAGEAVLAGGEFDKLTNVFCAAAAAAGIFQAELGFDLARHHNPGTPGITDIRLGDSLAQAYIHERPLSSNDYEKHSQYARRQRGRQG